MIFPAFIALLLADDGWPHWLWPLVPLAWLVVLFLLFRFVFWPWRSRGRRDNGFDRARGILAERYASGEITHDEYRERLDRLGEAERAAS